jgi:uncharacterized protein (TIRG00374 family)
MKRSFFTFLKIIVAAILLAVLIVVVDWRTSWEVARSADPFWFIVYIAIVVIGIAISASKWKYLTDFLGFSFSFGKHFRWYIAGTFVNNFLPSVIGGDTYRALALGKRGGSRALSATSVLFDRYTGLVSMAMLAVLFSLFVLPKILINPIWMVFFVGAIFGVLLQIFILPGWRGSILTNLLRVFPKKAMRMKEAIERFRVGSGAMTISFLWGALFSFIGVGVANYVLFRALGVSIGFFEFLSVIFFINIIAAIPVSINNIGVKEWAYYVFFGFLGVAPEVSVTAAILSRFAQMGISLFGIPTFFAQKNEREIISSKEKIRNEDKD